MLGIENSPFSKGLAKFISKNIQREGSNSIVLLLGLMLLSSLTFSTTLLRRLLVVARCIPMFSYWLTSKGLRAMLYLNCDRDIGGEPLIPCLMFFCYMLRTIIFLYCPFNIVRNINDLKLCMSSICF